MIPVHIYSILVLDGSLCSVRTIRPSATISVRVQTKNYCTKNAANLPRWSSFFKRETSIYRNALKGHGQFCSCSI